MSRNKKELWWGLFRTGKHTSLEGKTVNVDTELLDQIISATHSFAYQNDEIPIVIGHPVIDSPKWGSIKKQDIKREGEELLGKPSNLVDQFCEWVDKKLYDTISIALRKDFSIKHIGFLGAHAPAVTGLTPVHFAEGQDEVVTLSFGSVQQYELSSWWFKEMVTLFRNLKNKLIEEKGQEEADKTFPENVLIDLSEPPSVWAKEPMIMSSNFSENNNGESLMTKEEEDKLKADKAAADLKAVDLKAQLDAKTRNEKILSFASFCESEEMVKKITPAIKTRVVAIMDALDSTGELTFAENGTEVKVSALDELKNILKLLPDQVSFGEQFTHSNAGEIVTGIAAEAKTGADMAEIVNRKRV